MSPHAATQNLLSANQQPSLLTGVNHGAKVLWIIGSRHIQKPLAFVIAVLISAAILFASRALSHLAPQEWAIKQLGHTDGQMLKDHYAEWITEETGLPLSRVDAINEAMCAGWSAC